jgi:predicted nucleic acid-binding Zn ribbon protein
MMGTNNPNFGNSAGSSDEPARPRTNAKRAGGQNEQQRRARARILVEWLGGLNPPDPSRNIHQPGEYIDDLLKSVGVSDGVDEERLREVWGKVAGQFVAQHTVPESISRGVLVLRVLQPAMKFHLQQMSSKLLENLHRELGKDTVKKVVFKIG